MTNICISGLGDIGERVASCWLAKGAAVHGIRRTDLPSTVDIEPAVSVINADLDDPSTLVNLPLQDAILYHFAPPPSMGETDPRFRALLAATTQNGTPARIVLLSTTAVYGDCGGEWITEDAPANPQTDRGRRRLDAEEALIKWATENDTEYVILRVSGIYGPGRLPLERLKQSLPILREDLAPYSNRIHADDLALVCVAAAEMAPSGSIYNVCDGKPSTMSHYFKTIARVFALPAPPEVDREQAEKVLSPGMLSYLRESRRMTNEKMLNELGITLMFPDLETGLADLRKHG